MLLTFFKDMNKLCLLISLTFLSACSLADKDVAVKNASEQWADAYFNYNLDEANELTCDESRKWISFAASNVTTQDFEMLGERQERAAVVAEECHFGADTVAYVYLTVTNFLEPDTIGGAGKWTEEGKFMIELRKRSAGWQVRMEGLPQNGMQSRD